MGLVRVPGGPGGGRPGLPARRAAGGPARPGGLPVPLDLAPLAGDPDRPGTPAVRRDGPPRPLPGLPVGRPPGRVHDGGLHPIGPAALDARRLPVALPPARPLLGGALRDPAAVLAPAGPDGGGDAAGDRAGADAGALGPGAEGGAWAARPAAGLARPDARPLRLGPGRRRARPTRPARAAGDVPVHQLVVSQRPA